MQSVRCFRRSHFPRVDARHGALALQLSFQDRSLGKELLQRSMLFRRESGKRFRQRKARAERQPVIGVRPDPPGAWLDGHLELVLRRGAIAIATFATVSAPDNP